MSYYAAGGWEDVLAMMVGGPVGSTLIRGAKYLDAWLPSRTRIDSYLSGETDRFGNPRTAKAAQEDAWATTPPVEPAIRRHRVSTRRTRRTRRWRPGLPLNPRYRTRGRRVTDPA